MPAGKMTREDAARFVAEHSAPLGTSIMREADRLLASPEHAAASVRRAAKSLHPDAGGTKELFQRLQEAKAVLGL